MDTLTKLYDDLYANGYHNKLGFSHSINLIEKGIKKYIKDGRSILDVGCSSGTALQYLEENGYQASGIDISNNAIELAIKYGAKDCKVSQSHSIDYPNDKFHGILCTDVLEHVDESNINETFREFNRVTLPKAHIFLKIALKTELNRGWDTITNKHGYSDLHILVKGKDYWFGLFKNHNLQVVEVIKETESVLEIILKKH
jgi:2-polyprenyl-3-methyl-5-hydroxy-6-metoxy-1,4-benzoquinol methylase